MGEPYTMPMEIDRRQLKNRAREAMAQSPARPWLITLVYLGMTTGLSYVLDLLGMSGSLFVTLAYTMYRVVVLFGYRLWAIWSCRRLEPGLGSLMEGFSVAGRVIWMELLITLKVMGWCVLLALPVAFLTGGMMPPALYAIVLGGVILAVQLICLRYSLSPYFLADHPEMGGPIAIERSIRSMKGWCWELAKLYLSFWPWYLASFALMGLSWGLGLVLGGCDLAAIATMDPLGAYEQVAICLAGPVATTLSVLLPLPLSLFFIPYLEVSVAEFYCARIALPDQAEDPYGDLKMPPL